MEWKPDIALPQKTPEREASVESAPLCNIKDLDTQIKACGDKVRELEAKKADKVNQF